MKKKNRQAEQCIEDILLENYDRYYRLAYSYTHNEADAEDIVQNGVYKAILYSDSLENLPNCRPCQSILAQPAKLDG